MSNDVSTALQRGMTTSGPLNTSKTVAWPAIALLAFIPTANVQMPGDFVNTTETYVSTTRRRTHPDRFEIYTSWYVPSWEDISVPKLPTMAHVRADLKFQGALKWRPYQP